jgi:hypothetical protein
VELPPSVLICGCSPTLLHRGADAAGDLLLDIFGIHVGARDARIAKATDPPDPLIKPGFVSTIREIAGALAKVAQPVEQAALLSALRQLDGRDWYRLNEEQQGKAIERAMGAILGVPEIIAPKIGDVLQAAGKDVVLGTKAHAAKAWELDITPSFEAVDMKVVNAIASSQAFYIRNQYGQREAALSAVARKVVADGVKDGLDKHDIGKNLKAALAGTSAERSEGYYRMVASVFAARARSYASLSSFEEAGIEEYEISCALDEVSCLACRLMDGRTFTVASALGTFQKIANDPDPESVVDHQPFMGTMRHEDGSLGVYFKQGGERKTVAHVEESAVGQKDERGSFSKVMSRGGLERAGLSSPPWHPSCRCLATMVGTTATSQVPADIAPPAASPIEEPVAPTAPPAPEETFPPAVLPANLPELVRPAPAPGRVENPEATPAPTPAEVAEQEAWIAHQKLVRGALAKLAALKPTGDEGFVEHGLAHQPPDADGDYAFPFTKGPKGEVNGNKLAGAAKQKAKEIPLTSITLLSPDAPEAQIKAAIVAKTTPTAILVKKNGTLYPASLKDQAILVASHLKGEPAAATKTVDLDKAAAKKPTSTPEPASAVVPPPAATPVRPPKLSPLSAPVPMGDASNILHQKDGGAKGSNDGGFYTGADGVKRYVKFYNDAAQPHCEHLANTIYTDLGHTAPNSTLFEHDGKVAYASDLFHGGKTLKEIGGLSAISKDDARAILKGFVGDVLTGNWDAVGTGFDNVMRLPDGRWVRVDNGGTFLMRAKEGRKPDAALNAISEWEVFFSSKNPYYSQLASKAGVSSADDMKDVVVGEIRKVLALRDAAGGWAPYVVDRIPDCPMHDRARVLDMLTMRSKLLEEKLVELTAPPKPAPAPGEARYVAKQYSTTLPASGLRINHLPESAVIDDHYGKIDRHNPVKMPSGEKYTDYQRRAEAAVKDIPSSAMAGIKSFTSSGYTTIRASEDAGSPNKSSNDIQKAFGVATPEPGTVFRGITGLSRDVIEKYLTGETFQLGKAGGATSSTSWLIDVAVDSFMGGRHDPASPAQYKILFVMNGKTQIPVETISSVGDGERELLMKRDAMFRVTGLSRAKGTKRVLVVEAEEVVGEAHAAAHVPTAHHATSAPKAPEKPVVVPATLAEALDKLHASADKDEQKAMMYAIKQTWTQAEILAAINGS